MKWCSSSGILRMQWIGIQALGLALLLFSACARSQSNPSNQETGNYFALGEPALMISIPGEVTAKETQVSPEMLEQIKRFDTYQYQDSSGLVIGIFQFAQYNMMIQNSPQEALAKGVDKMFRSMDTYDGKFTTEALEFKHIPGNKAVGSFTFKGNLWKFQSVVFMRADAMWQIWAAAKDELAYTSKLESMMTSLYFR